MKHRIKFKLLFSLPLVFCAGSILAQYTPQGGAERKAIMDALRVPIKRELKKAVIFQVGLFRVKDGWAVISATPLKPDGNKFDWRNTKYEKCMRGGVCDNGVQALLKNTGNAWHVIEYAVGSTDWAMGRACKKHNCPPELRQ